MSLEGVTEEPEQAGDASVLVELGGHAPLQCQATHRPDGATAGTASGAATAAASATAANASAATASAATVTASCAATAAACAVTVKVQVNVGRECCVVLAEIK